MSPQICLVVIGHTPTANTLGISNQQHYQYAPASFHNTVGIEAKQTVPQSQVNSPNMPSTFWICCNCHCPNLISVTQQTCVVCAHHECRICQRLARGRCSGLHEMHTRHSVPVAVTEDKKVQEEMKRHVSVSPGKKTTNALLKGEERHVDDLKGGKTTEGMLEGEERHC